MVHLMLTAAPTWRLAVTVLPAARACSVLAMQVSTVAATAATTVLFEISENFNGCSEAVELRERELAGEPAVSRARFARSTCSVVSVVDGGDDGVEIGAVTDRLQRGDGATQVNHL